MAINIKKNLLAGAVAIAAGLLLALGPQFLFKPCLPHGDEYNRCHWSVLAVLGTGSIVAALGICVILIGDLKIQIGLVTGIFLTSIVTLSIPYSLIKGCSSHEMRCWKYAFPGITIVSAVILAGSAAYMVYLWKKTK